MMLKRRAIFYHSRLIDLIDAAMLEAVNSGRQSLKELAEYIGQPGKIAVASFRLKRMEKNGWVRSAVLSCCKSSKKRVLTAKGRKLLAECLDI